MNVRPSHLLDDRIFDFQGLELGSKAFDENAPDIPKLR
jgi:tRNA 2-thiocytidine biosynthesis protein TtcA